MFYAGVTYQGNPGTGLLYLRVNDSSVSDNGGYFDVTIVADTDPCPGYTPAAIGEPIVYEQGLPNGPGVELKALLSKVGITSSPTCSCNARAAQMDKWGERECLRRLPEIAGWLREEAEKRDLWFFYPAGLALIVLAILLAALKRLWRGIKQ